jgi:hypothetical protein
MIAGVTLRGSVRHGLPSGSLGTSIPKRGLCPKPHSSVCLGRGLRPRLGDEVEGGADDAVGVEAVVPVQVLE